MKLIGKNPEGIIILITNAELHTMSQKAFDYNIGYNEAEKYFGSEKYIDNMTTILACPAILEKVNSLTEMIGGINKELNEATKILLNKEVKKGD